MVTATLTRVEQAAAPQEDTSRSRETERETKMTETSLAFFCSTTVVFLFLCTSVQGASKLTLETDHVCCLALLRSVV